MKMRREGNANETGADRFQSHAGGEAVAEVHALFIRHIDVIRGFIRGLLRDQSLADDVLQETFLTVARKASDYEPGTSFPRWACAVARFKVLEMTRRESGNLRFFSGETLEALAASHSPEAEDMRLHFLDGCVRELPPTMRNMVERRYVGEQKPAEIAREVGWTVESVYVTLSRARVAIRECLRMKLREAND